MSPRQLCCVCSQVFSAALLWSWAWQGLTSDPLVDGAVELLL